MQLYSGNTNGWDAHKDVLENHGDLSRRTDRPIAGLLTDLESRGLLEDTLVLWGGEFGRMPMSEQGTGRDHNPWGYTVWLAGGGIRGGTVFGATDDFGLRAEHDKVHIHDLHATILHLMGLPVPSGLRGRVVTEALDSTWLADNPVRTLDADRPGLYRAVPHESLPEPTEEELSTLKALGYID